MAERPVWDLRVGRDTVAHIWEHGITPEQLFSILERHDFRIFPNRGAGRAAHIMIGLDEHGMCIAIPMDETDEFGTWEVVTAYPCKPGEHVRLLNALGGRRRR